jgi:predicted hydrocarbon binding protein
MCDELFEQFQSGASVILYRMGEGYAKKVSEAFPKLGLSPEEVMLAVKRLGYIAGWGKFQFDLSNPDSVDCTVEDCAFVLRRKDAGDTTCYFLSGILGTIGTQIYGKKYIAREMTCAASGGPMCRFKVTADYRSA